MPQAIIRMSDLRQVAKLFEPYRQPCPACGGMKKKIVGGLTLLGAKHRVMSREDCPTCGGDGFIPGQLSSLSALLSRNKWVGFCRMTAEEFAWSLSRPNGSVGAGKGIDQDEALINAILDSYSEQPKLKGK